MKKISFVLPRFKSRAVPRRRVPSGLLSLAAEASMVEGITVEVVDAESAAWGTKEVLEYLSSTTPDAIGISICSPTFGSAMDLMAGIRAKMPATTLIAGGKHITHCWHSAMPIQSYADAMVRGEGESAVSVLAQAVASGEGRARTISALSALPNVWVHGKQVAPTLPPPIDLQRAHPWPTEALSHDLSYYHGDRMLVEFSRGCPGQCGYCLASRDRQRLSFRPVVQVVETLAKLRNEGFSSFFFTDDDFAASPNHLKNLLEAIIDSEVGIEFDANVRPDSLIRCEKLAPMLKLAGCRCLWLGIESGSSTILKSFNKGFTPDICERAVAIALLAADVVKTNWIIGAPLESEETVEASMNLAQRLRQVGPHVPHVSFMIPYPGTPVCDEALELGLIPSCALEKMTAPTHAEPVMPSKFLHMPRLKELFREFHIGYFTPDFFTSASPAVAGEAKLVLTGAGI